MCAHCYTPHPTRPAAVHVLRNIGVTLVWVGLVLTMVGWIACAAWIVL